jgi:hypothetical protein
MADLALAACGLLAALRDDTLAVPDVAGFPADGKDRTALLSAQGVPGTWQERECLHVAGPDDREAQLEEVPDLAQDRRGHQQRAFRMPQESDGGQ